MILVTGSCGLVGSAFTRAALLRGEVVGIDNDGRREYFGKSGSTADMMIELIRSPGYHHHGADVRDRAGVDAIVKKYRPDAIVHCAAQPAHEWSKMHPRLDFDINVGGTVNVLDAATQFVPKSPVVMMSSSKVYGTSVNRIPVVEQELRWDYLASDGVDESFPLDGSYHSPYGAHKAAADIIAQEYAHEYGLPVTILRPNCMTGKDHAGVEMHGFLSYLLKCWQEGRPYKVFGDGKQVRDNVDASDVARAIFRCIDDPSPGEAFNLGGGRGNDTSILEMAAQLDLELEFHDARGADHLVYITDYRKFENRYGWRPHQSLADVVDGIVGAGVCLSLHPASTGAGASASAL